MREPRPNPIPPKDRIAVGREEMADLLSISPGQLDKMVREELLPGPRVLGGRLVYCVREHEEAMSKVPRKGEDRHDDDGLPEP